MNSPTLLVGLGGTGSKIVAKVSEMISDEQRRNISCVIFDTDANDIPEIKQHHSEIKVVQTSTRMTVGEYLEADHHARDSWFPVNPPLNRKVLSEGAGQVRSISRLGFESALRSDQIKPLHEAIQNLYKVDHKKADQALRVTIVSSLAGGTGSGLIVPVAMYIRQYLEDHFHQDSNITRGFFILPEVFYDAIPADQRNNLKSNAYASLRELDAFLMKGNQTLSEEYADSVRLEMPDPETGLYADYNLAPYDFCFLFDAQNANGEKLNSLEQYMDHAANILYAMSIGPMNKRSNSSEDNVIRKLAKEKGRNRYAGAGASRLLYPYEDICSLIGLNWASSSISRQWLEFDHQVQVLQERARKEREEGLGTKDVDPLEQYVLAIQNAAENGKVFASSIVHTVDRTNERNGQPLYKEYLDALNKHVESQVDKDTESIKLFNTLSQEISNVGSDGTIEDARVNVHNILDSGARLDEYQKALDKFLSLSARNIAYSMFKGARSEGQNDEDYFLDHVMKVNGEYLHPNAMRYLLINIYMEMKQALVASKKTEETGRKRFKEFMQNPYVDLGDEGIDGYTAKGLINKKKKTIERLREVAETGLAEADELKKMTKAALRSAVYEEGLNYIKDLIEGYQSFYDALEAQLGSLETRKKEIYTKYTQAPGMTVRYVAASRPALDALVARYPYTGSMINVDSDLSRAISDKVFEYAQRSTKPNPSRYFGTLFEEQILRHYQNMVDKKVAGQLDKGIFNAMKLEANLLLDEDDRDSDMAVDRYVRNIIDDTRALSTPFIEKPSELTATAIDACAFNEELMPRRGDESYDARLIQEELVAKGGQGDEDVDRNTVLFYKSYYGLRANSLSKFAPPRNSETHSRHGGEYYNAYTDLIRGIHPNSKLSQEITPHIDKSWHLAAKMPDLDEKSQSFEEYGISSAFFWAVVLDLLEFKTDSTGRKMYELKNIRLGLEDGTLLCSGDKRSETIQDVLQALSIQPTLVNAIRRYAEDRIHDDVEQNHSITDARLYKEELHTILIPLDSSRYPSLPGRNRDENRKAVGLFDLPWILKASVSAGHTNDRKYTDLLRVAMSQVISYIANFCSPDELSGQIRNYMTDQFNEFCRHDRDVTEVSPDYLADTLDIAANVLDEYDLRELCGSIRDEADALKRQANAGLEPVR